jgi:hypothetical protein
LTADIAVLVPKLLPSVDFAAQLLSSSSRVRFSLVQ